MTKLGEVAGKMRRAIQWIKTAPWFDRIGTYQSSTIPPVMNSDPRYRALYQLYRELKNEQFLLQIHQSYSYQWKRTDKLYEIWGYLQFIKTLAGEGLRFVPEQGWLYSQTIDRKSMLVPTLHSNTQVVFRKEDVRIHLVYEAHLPSQSRLTSTKEPLYQEEHITARMVVLMSIRMNYSLGPSFLILNTAQEIPFGTSI